MSNNRTVGRKDDLCYGHAPHAQKPAGEWEDWGPGLEPLEPRLLLSAAAYVLIEHLRRTALKNTELAAAQVDTIRLKLLKVAARVVISVRRVVLHLSSAYPLQNLFRRMVAQLLPAGPAARPAPS